MSEATIGIIDYGMGNLLSVKNAFQAVGASARIINSAEQLREVDAIVLPGVGAFGKGMEHLRERGFVAPLSREVRENRKPMLGICLGLQLLAERGTELGDHEGLGWFTGAVQRLAPNADVRVPHIGWNDVDGRGPLFEGIPANASFYFVHAYHFVPSHADGVCGTTEYGERFVSALGRGNVHAVQFHPEKSHQHGLKLLKNFSSLVRSPAC